MPLDLAAVQAELLKHRAALLIELGLDGDSALAAQRAEGQPKPAWRMQADHLLLPGSVRVRADDAMVSDLIENRLESLAHSLLKDPKTWQANSAFAPSKLASRLAAQRGSADTVEDAQAKAQGAAQAPGAGHHTQARGCAGQGGGLAH
mgnify:CR=1 FL=1